MVNCSEIPNGSNWRDIMIDLQGIIKDEIKRQLKTIKIDEVKLKEEAMKEARKIVKGFLDKQDIKKWLEDFAQTCCEQEPLIEEALQKVIDDKFEDISINVSVNGVKNDTIN